MGQKDHSLRELTGYRMRRAMLPVLARVNELLAPLGLRRTTFSALVIVRDNPGMRQGELAELLAMEKPNLVNIIDKLEKAELIERRRSDEDRRVNALFVTEKGRRRCEAGLSEICEYEQSLTEGFEDQDVDALHTALDRIRRNAEARRENGDT